MAQVTIVQAAAALGVSVDTVRRRIKAGLLRASRNSTGPYLVEVPDSALHHNDASAHNSDGHDSDAATLVSDAAAQVNVAGAGQTPPASGNGPGVPGSRSRATDQHLFNAYQPRGNEFLEEVRNLKELLEVERQRNAELREHVAFQRRQLEGGAELRERLVALLEAQQQQAGIEQLQKILRENPPRDER